MAVSVVPWAGESYNPVMPTRRNAKGPGEFIRDHLQDSGGRDYVGGIYKAYKAHLRRAGVRKLPCRPTFHTYIWMLKETGAIIFDGAEAISFGISQPEVLPVDYAPACGMSAPRHYYRVVDLQHRAFISPKGVWMEQRGLAPPVARRPTPRIPVVPERVSVVPSPPAVEIPPFRLSRQPSQRVAQRLIRHLRELEELGVEQPEVEEELDSMAVVLRAWLGQVEE